MIAYWDYEQRSEDWYNIRRGLVTASRASEVISKGTGRARYMRELAADVMTGESAHWFSTSAMQWGIDTEPQARSFYELETGYDVIETGFCTNTAFPGCGVSPDGLIGIDGLVEFKCPNTTTHIEYLLAGKLPAKYRAQVQMQMMVTERAWCDFVSFDPRVIKGQQMMIVSVARDDEYIEKLSAAISEFTDSLAAMLAKLGANGDTE